MPARVIRRLRAATLRRDDGLTLVELIVSMGLSTLLGAVTLTLFININTSTSDTTDRTISSSSARDIIQAWTAYLRVADGTTTGSRANRITWLAAKDMMFYADLGNRSMSAVATTAAPTAVWLRLDASGELVEEQFASTAATGSAPKVCRVLATAVSVRSALFEAFDDNGAALPSSGLGNAPTASTGCRPRPATPPATNPPAQVVQANLQSVNSVTVDFIVKDTHAEHPLEFTSSAILPALGGA